MEGSHRGDKLKPILYPPRQTMTTSQTYESERLQGYEKCEEYKMSCSVARSDLFFNLFKLDYLLNVMGGGGKGWRKLYAFARYSTGATVTIGAPNRWVSQGHVIGKKKINILHENSKREMLLLLP